VDPAALANWCAFHKLEPKNPRLFGCSQCYNTDDGEVKFVSALFFRYSEDKTRPPHKRWKLEGWVSTLHFNSHEFRVGDEHDSVVGKQKNAAIRRELTDLEQAQFRECFMESVSAALDHCRPRMQLRAEKKKSLVELFRKKQAKQIRANQKSAKNDV
jgi:hypothetical protein